MTSWNVLLVFLTDTRPGIRNVVVPIRIPEDEKVRQRPPRAHYILRESLKGPHNVNGRRIGDVTAGQVRHQSLALRLPLGLLLRQNKKSFEMMDV